MTYSTPAQYTITGEHKIHNNIFRISNIDAQPC